MAGHHKGNSLAGERGTANTEKLSQGVLLLCNEATTALCCRFTHAGRYQHKMQVAASLVLMHSTEPRSQHRRCWGTHARAQDINSPPQKCLKNVWRTTEVTTEGPTTFFAAASSTSAFWTRGLTEHVLKTAKDCSSCPVDLAEKATCGSSKPCSLMQAEAGCG